MLREVYMLEWNYHRRLENLPADHISSQKPRGHYLSGDKKCAAEAGSSITDNLLLAVLCRLRLVVEDPVIKLGSLLAIEMTEWW